MSCSSRDTTINRLATAAITAPRNHQKSGTGNYYYDMFSESLDARYQDVKRRELESVAAAESRAAEPEVGWRTC